jgi:hypothetical protein
MVHSQHERPLVRLRGKRGRISLTSPSRAGKSFGWACKHPETAALSRLIGDAGVSIEEQGTDPHLDELRAAGR